MNSHPLDLGAPGRPAELSAIDRALEQLSDNALPFAKLGAAAKAQLLRQCLARVLPLAESWATISARHKRLAPSEIAEEWVGPWILMRALRQFCDSLDAIAAFGKPPFGRRCTLRPDGRVVADVMPSSRYDAAAYLGCAGQIHFAAGLGLADVRSKQASFYGRALTSGKVALILGAGNRAVIPALDLLSKLVADGEVCVVKLNPVNEWIGPIFEELFAPLSERGYLRFVYGGADIGQYLCEHARVDSLHMTGSHHTHDAIVWGASEAERERRRNADQPKNTRPLSSELGNVSPMAIVPADYSEAELAALVRLLVTSVVNNASFNCNATKLLILARGWKQRDRFLTRFSVALERVAPRYAYYPGALERYASLTAGHSCRRLGSPASPQHLPWTLVTDLAPNAPDEPLFQTEPFCAIVSETTLNVSDPVEFLEAASTWMNTRLWGTLNAGIICPPALERRPDVAAALDRAVTTLRYGVVGINTWPALGFALPSLPWGGHPSSTLADIQSGLGWVHNTYLFEGIEKAVVRGWLVPRPTPPWIHGRAGAVAWIQAFLRYEAAPSVATTLGIFRHALVPVED